MGTIGLYWVYPKARRKDDSRGGNSTLPRQSEVADHPDTRLPGLAANGEVTRIRRGESPKRHRLRLQPNGLGFAVEINMQQRGAIRSHSGYKQASGIDRPTQICEVGIAVHVDCSGPLLPQGH